MNGKEAYDFYYGDYPDETELYDDECEKGYPFETYIDFMGVEVEANTGIPAKDFKPFNVKGTL